MAKAAGALMLLAACAAGQTVEGTIVNAVTGGAIAGAKVMLRHANQVAYSAATNENGIFRIEGVKPGAYSPTFAADHYFSALGGRGGPEIHVGDGGLPVHIESRMIPYARISGRVIDGRGDPVPKARMDLTTGQAFWTAQTDAQGRFNLDSVIPSTANYTLGATAPAGWKAPDPDPDGGPPRGWTRTFYPGVAFQEQAAAIAVRPDGEVSSVDIKLLAVPRHTIRGVVLNPDGTPAPKVAVSLWYDGSLPHHRTRLSRRIGAGWHIRISGRGLWRLAAFHATGS